MGSRFAWSCGLVMVVALQMAGGQTTSAPAAQSAPAVPKDWVMVKGWNVITFWAPPELQDQKAMGVDSMVGVYKSEKMTVSYDYGWYSSPLDDPKYKREAIKLDGRDGFLVRGEKFVGVYVPRVGQGDNPSKFEMSVRCEAGDEEKAVAIVMSVKFEVPATEAGATQKGN